MGTERLPVRLPALPSWEKLLTRLSVLPETKVDHRSLSLELISLISNDANSVAGLFPRLCVFLPRITGCQGVVIWAKGLTDSEIIASNLSSNKTRTYMELKIVQKMSRINHRSFNRRLPLRLSVGKTVLTNCQSIHLGEINNRQAYLLAVGERAITGETIHTLEVICQAIGLRLKNLSLSQSVRSQNHKLNNLTQQLGEGMALLDRDLKVTLWNRALQRLTGYKTNEALGQNINQVFRRTDTPDWLTSLVANPGTKELRHTHSDFEIMTKSGDRLWLNCLVSIYKNDSNEIDQLALVARDISHKKTLEQKKNEFISIATHELRTPLTAIKGYLSLLERSQENLTSKQLSYLSQTTKASNRLACLAEDLLRVTQIDQDRLPFKPQNIHLFPILKRVVRDFKPKAAAKGVTLSLTNNHLRDNVRLDPERTEQIFANLIDNATKYTEQGAIKIWLENIENRHGQCPQLVINIRDTGIGIGTKNIEEIFEKFHRAHRPEQSRERGAGLGLYIVKSFVEKQNGTITVKSRAGKGSHFTIAFPLEPPRKSKEWQ